MSDLESELESVEAQRRQLKNQRSQDEPKESEDQRLMQELERQQEDGEAYRSDTPASELDDTVATEPPEVEAVSPPETDDDLPTVDMPDDDLDVIGLDEELADQEKEVIGLDEEFARASAGSSPYQPASTGESADDSTEVEIDRDETSQDERPGVSAERVTEPISEDVVDEESREEPKKKTSAAEQFASTPLQPELSALENLSADFSESSHLESEDAETLSAGGAMFDDLGAGMEDWGMGSEDAPAGSSTATLASEEPDDFTATFFGQSGQPGPGSGAEPQKTSEGENTAPNMNWTDSLDDEDEELTKEELWEREFPVLGEDEEGNLYGEEEPEDQAAVAVNADDPFSDVSDQDDYQDEDYPDEDEDARPLVIDSEYGDGYEEEEGFEGVDESAYEDYDEGEDDYDLAFQPRKVGPFAVPHGRKGNLIIVSVVVGLLLLAGTGYFVMQTFTPDELTDFMVADGDIPEDMVPHENTGAQTPPVTTNPEMQELLSETEAEQQLDIDELMDTTGPIQSQPEPEPETVVAEKTPAPQPGEKLEEATKLLEPSEDNELLKELEQSQILQESQQEIEQAVKQEEKLAELIDPNATIVAFNTILPVAYNTTDIRVLSFRLEIEMGTVDGANVIRQAMPIFEDMMISTVEGFFQQRFYTDVVYAKEKLRDKLREVFNKSLNNGKIQKANFTDFAIQ
ncbi:conserved protein of unknown function [Nitrospina watsonii]|uniref:Flagellar protein FliL n=2 Tax=Nitrospina watsonii TaxID=1323948 RepID=A0ABN8VV05_9BACT|nr:conserved protein of unknown function [Nitrospina watsonii]